MPMKRKYTRHARFKNFLLFIWNPRTKMFCNKTCPQWAQYILYYSGFYIILFIFTVLVTLTVIWAFLRFDTPWGDAKIISNPALSILPNLVRSKITYSSPGYPSKQIEEINNFLKKYEKLDTSRYRDCYEESDDNNNKPCFFNTSKLGPCGKEPYGYTNMEPCVLLKLNKVLGWTPQKFIQERSLQKREEGSDLETTCAGTGKADIENIEGFNYFPSPVFPSSFFPFSNKEHYMQPLIGVQIFKPTRGMLLAIECTVKVSGKTLSSKIFRIETIDRS